MNNSQYTIFDFDNSHDHHRLFHQLTVEQKGNRICQWEMWPLLAQAYSLLVELSVTHCGIFLFCI